ncbi:T9SS type A sorting domain-containing protein [Altibacter lentus]|uniref:T9SS type A sorting domain-containing protein n=1 Tax=Altibacter lentus TaxID=1223410 RepID=UPI000556E892|nr:T9SS type A sorting domain-containing protein [Altibacter lentus]
MKKTMLLTLFACVVGTGSLFAQFVVKPTFFETTGVSNDGLIVGYEAQGGSYSIWDADNDTFTPIGGVAPGLGHGGSAKFSEDGNFITGAIMDTYQGNDYSVMAVYDVTTETWTPLGHLNQPVDAGLSSAYNISGDGSTVVGSAWVTPNPNNTGLTTNACVWTAADGIVNLGSLYADINRGTRAQAANIDGSIVVGWQDYNGPWKSAVWRKDANGDYLPNEYLLLDPNGDPTDENNQLSEATAISADGNWIGGRSDWVTNGEPWIWSESTGVIMLGTLAANGQGHVTAINHDASIVIGYFQIGPWDPNVPFVWTPNGGLQDFNSFVTNTLGYDMGASPVYAPNAMSPNGEFITGWGYDPTIGPWGDLFTFRLQLPATPINDSCQNAPELTCGDVVTNSTIFGTDSGGNGSPDVYYSYTGNGTPEFITLNACSPNTNFPTTIRVFSDCSLSNQLAFNDSSCENQPNLMFESDGVSTYYIMVEGYSSSHAGSFELAITCSFNIVNDECQGALPVACGETITGTTEFATDSIGEASNDVYYSYEGTGTPEHVTISLCGSGTTFDSFIRVFSDCSGTEIAVNNDYCGDQSQLTFESDGFSTYYIMIEGNGTAFGNFIMDISCEAVLDVAENALSATILYPNPVQERLQFSSQVEIDTATVYSITGVEITTQTVGTMKGELDFSAYASGVYFVKLNSGENFETFRIIKQ